MKPRIERESIYSIYCRKEHKINLRKKKSVERRTEGLQTLGSSKMKDDGRKGESRRRGKSLLERKSEATKARERVGKRGRDRKRGKYLYINYNSADLDNRALFKHECIHSTEPLCQTSRTLPYPACVCVCVSIVHFKESVTMCLSF